MLIHVADTAVEVPSKSVDCQKQSLWHCNVEWTYYQYFVYIMVIYFIAIMSV